MIRHYENKFKKKLCKLICVKHKSTLKTAQDDDETLENDKDNTCYDKKTTFNYKSLYLNDLSMNGPDLNNFSLFTSHTNCSPVPPPIIEFQNSISITKK